MRVPQEMPRDVRPSGSRHLGPAAAVLWGVAGIALAIAVLVMANHP